jgi:hypothetical protein
MCRNDPELFRIRMASISQYNIKLKQNKWNAEY